MERDGLAVLGVILLIVVLILAVIYGPLISIWAINLLFGLKIPNWQLDTWFATLWLSGTIAGVSKAVTSGKD